METPNHKRRPVLVVSRDEVIPVLNNVVVAPVTSTIRDIPTCVPVGPGEGIDRSSVAAFDNLAAMPKSVLTQRLGQLGVGGAGTSATRSTRPTAEPSRRSGASLALAVSADLDVVLAGVA